MLYYPVTSGLPLPGSVWCGLLPAQQLGAGISIDVSIGDDLGETEALEKIDLGASVTAVVPDAPGTGFAFVTISPTPAPAPPKSPASIPTSRITLSAPTSPTISTPVPTTPTAPTPAAGERRIIPSSRSTI